MYTNPSLREELREDVLWGDRGGLPGQWSARKAQILKDEYEAHGGGYLGPLTRSQRSLRKWSRQRWGTRSGRNSVIGVGATGERYLPRAVLRRLSAKDYRATTAAKRRSLRAGAQYSPQPREVRRKIRSCRSGDAGPRRSIPSSSHLRRVEAERAAVEMLGPARPWQAAVVSSSEKVCR